jgi:hypothetical protein
MKFTPVPLNNSEFYCLNKIHHGIITNLDYHNIFGDKTLITCKICKNILTITH